VSSYTYKTGTGLRMARQAARATLTESYNRYRRSPLRSAAKQEAARDYSAAVDRYGPVLQPGRKERRANLRYNRRMSRRSTRG
jgi:hypothetical protein